MPRLYTAKEAAEHLGCSRSSFYRAIGRGVFTEKFDSRGKRYWDTDDLDRGNGFFEETARQFRQLHSRINSLTQRVEQLEGTQTGGGA